MPNPHSPRPQRPDMSDDERPDFAAPSRAGRMVRSRAARMSPRFVHVGGGRLDAVMFFGILRQVLQPAGYCVYFARLDSVYPARLIS
jgi:hypothetical protein